MIDISDKSKCCGCGACSVVCPTNCISMEEDHMGVIFPEVDVGKCVHCEKCVKVCPMGPDLEHEFKGAFAYAAYANDKSVRFRGSSGGMFESFAAEFLRQGGVVYGALFTDDLKLVCQRATSIEQVRKMCKSKYIQSNCTTAFSDMQKEVAAGKRLMFCGTPCQVAAFRRLLGKKADLDHLILIDFFCHGVPSQKLFDKCVGWVERHNGIKVEGYEFRAKRERGATPHYFTYSYIDKKGRHKTKTDLYFKDPFYYGFQKYITMRDSCYGCAFGKGGHLADITIGDFHDIDRYVKGVNRFRGISTVIINTSKGETMWNSVIDKMTVFPMEIERLVQEKCIFAGGTVRPKLQRTFSEDLVKMDFDAVVKKWFDARYEWKKAIYYRLPTIIRMRIKRILGE